MTIGGVRDASAHGQTPAGCDRAHLQPYMRLRESVTDTAGASGLVAPPEVFAAGVSGRRRHIAAAGGRGGRC